MNTEWFWPATFCVDGDDIWFVYGKVCMLCKYSILDDKCQVVDEIPVNNPFQEGTFTKIIKVKEKLFFIPCWAENIIVYDTKKNMFTKILSENRNIMKFCMAYQVNNEIICIPSSYSEIVVIDTDKLNIIKRYDVSKEVQANNIKYFNSATLIDEKQVLMVSPQSSKIFVYNIERNKFENYEVDIDAVGFSYVIQLEDRMVLCDNASQKIYLYNLKMNKVESCYWPNNGKIVALYEMTENRFMIDDSETSWFGVIDKDFTVKMEGNVCDINDRDNYCRYLNGIGEKSRDEYIYFNNSDISFNWIKNDKIQRKRKINIGEEERLQIGKCVKKINLIKESFLYNLNDYIDELLKNPKTYCNVANNGNIVRIQNE